MHFTCSIINLPNVNGQLGQGFVRLDRCDRNVIDLADLQRFARDVVGILRGAG